MLHTMKVRLLILLSVSVLLFGATLVNLDLSRRKQAGILMGQQAELASATFDSLVSLRTRFLQQLAYDYSYWDELASFVRTADTAWVSEALLPVLRTYGADRVWIYGASGALVYAASPAHRIMGPEADIVRAPPVLRGLFAESRFAHFFLRTPRGVMEIRGASIHPTSDEVRRTSPRGYLFFGLEWDEAFILELEGLSSSTIAVASPESVPHRPKDPALIQFEKRLPGLEGPTMARLDVQKRIPGVDTFLRASQQYLLTSLAFAASLILLAVLSVTRWVSSPLRLISRSLATDDPAHVKRLKNDQTEFGDIASLIGRFFEQRQQLERENAERKRAEEALRVSHRFLEIANRHREMEPLLREFAVETERFTGCTLAGIHLSFSEDGAPLEMTVGFGENPSAQDRPCSRSEVRGICRAIMGGEVNRDISSFTSGGSCVMNRASRDLPAVLGALHGDICMRCWRLGYESVALVPIRVQDKTLGLIEVADQRQDMFPIHIVEALEAVAKQLGIAVLRVKAEERLAFMATHDLLTGLPNRAMIGFRLRPALAAADERKERVAVMMLDLDYFKSINDTLGHAAGDRLLQAASQRICAILRRTDTAVRMGGDEFMLILPQVVSADDASKVASKILEALRKPFKIDERELRVTGSIGIALYPDGGGNIDTLLKHADIAMYQAKGQGRNTFCTFAEVEGSRG
ncbi:MAG: diguanylate cyclase [Candidatus Eisenbacteria bacterium]|jgi:diguanylate cyclase (GGDEF)-like protein|nr:diguanylate cyclase [Candidatus Eisenbacteria bacterium]